MTGNRRFRGVDNKPGWINRALRDQRGDSLRERAAKRLGSSSIGPGGTLTVQDGAQIIFQGAAPVAFYVDTVTATGSGDLVVPLTFVPIPGSEDVKWNGLGQPGEWTRDGSLLTLTDPGLVSGDTVSIEYAYLYGAVIDALEELTWGSVGPYLIVTEGDLTDYSAPSFDDSGWLQGPGPVGHPIPTPEVGLGPGWSTAATDCGTTNCGFWLRRKVYATAGVKAAVSARPDGQFWLYVDGNLVASYTGTGTTTGEVTVEALLAAGEHVIALHINDDVPDAGDSIYGDLQVVVA